MSIHLKSPMKLALIQTNLIWENPQDNLDILSEKIASLEAGIDIIMLPEMFATGFTMQPEKSAAAMDGMEIQWMKEMAVNTGAVICGSLSMKDGGTNFNRFVWAMPNGDIQCYDKRHLFSMGEENNHYTAGKEKLLIDYKGWRIRPIVCYDLRFPVWCRNVGDYDLLLCVANWPALRSYAWRQLLIARAIENQCYVAAVNRVGADGNGIGHDGFSCVVSPKGEVMWEQGEGLETIGKIEIDLQTLLDFRQQFPVLDDADEFEIKD